MEKNKNRKCIFCRKLKDSDYDENFILERTKTCFVMLNIFPYNNGHLLIAPFRHVKNISSLSVLEGKELLLLLAKYEKKLTSKFKAQGFNIGANIGKSAGAGFTGHIHFHLVPRWIGDTNFISAISHAKVIPESLTSVFNKLKDEKK